LPRSLTAFQEIYSNRTAEATSDVVVPTSPFRFRVSDGHEVLPLRLPLYEENTSNLFAGKSVSSGTLVSHPFPVFGYAGKTIIFRADTASATSGLVIETLTKSGNWRTYDVVTYSANTDFFYTLTGNLVLARLKYTPATYPASVAEGEVILS
jgi:hypothetical protein